MSTYEVRFIQGWHNSFDLPEKDITPPGLTYKSLDYDPERYLSEDFFLREAREAKISFSRHRFIVEHYVEPPTDELIDVVLYTDSDEEIIDASQYDPETDQKEVIIDKYSKILVEIFKEGEIIFLGLVHTTDVRDEGNDISIVCTDFLDLIERFSKQLVYNIPGNDSYGYYFSKGILDELFSRIESMTGLHLKYTISPEIFFQYVSQYTICQQPDLNPVHIHFPTPQLYFDDYTIHTPVKRIASVSKKAVVFYQVFRCAYNQYLHDIAYVHYAAVIKFKKYAPDEGWSDVDEVRYNTTPGVFSYDDFIDQVDAWEDEFLGEMQSGQLFLCPGQNFYYIDDNHLVKFKQQWWSAAIPYNTGQHKYIDLIKVITLTNNITIYQKNDSIFFSIRTALPEGETVDITNNMIRKPFSAAGVSRDDAEFDALDILWEDPGSRKQKNIEHMKEVYGITFGEVYDKELNTSIDRYYPETSEEIPICLGCKIRFVRDDREQVYLIISHKPLKFKHEIRGYRIEVSNVE